MEWQALLSLVVGKGHPGCCSLENPGVVTAGFGETPPSLQALPPCASENQLSRPAGNECGALGLGLGFGEPAWSGGTTEWRLARGGERGWQEVLPPTYFVKALAASPIAHHDC